MWLKKKHQVYYCHAFYVIPFSLKIAQEFTIELTGHKDFKVKFLSTKEITRLEGPNIAGFNDTSTKTIALCKWPFKHRKHTKEELNAEYWALFFHELAHCWVGNHGPKFFKRMKSLVNFFNKATCVRIK